MSALKATVVPVTPLQQNCSVVWCTATMKAAVVDPGGDLDRIQAAVAANGVTVDQIWLTHGHLDHAGGAAELAETLGVPIVGPDPSDEFLLASLAQEGEKWGFTTRDVTPDRWLADGDTVSLGELTLDVAHTPGHTPGHVVFHHPPSRLALVGDVLFAGSVGRTDFPYGEPDALIRSVITKLWPMGDDTTFIPGHGGVSTFGRERQTNGFVADRVLAGNQRPTAQA